MTQVSNEHRRALADRDWWRAAGLVVGLNLRGWTFRDTASFIDTETDRTVELPGSVAKRLHTIALKDGRWPVVAKDDAEHDAIEAIFQTDINGVPTASRHPLSIEGLRAIAAKQFGVNDPELCAELASELLSLRQSHSTGAVVPSDEFIDRLVVQLWRYREIDIDKAGLQMAVTDALRLSPVHQDVEAANCASEGHDHPAHDWREACLKCGVFRGSDLHAHLPKEAEVTVTEEMVERAARAMEPLAFREEFTATDEWFELELEGRAQALGRARAALTAAFASRPSQGGEWVMVPMEPTLDMQNAGWADVRSQGLDPEEIEVGSIYTTMLSASPSPYGVEELVERAFKDGLAYGSNVECADPETAWMQSRVRASLTKDQSNG